MSDQQKRADERTQTDAVTELPIQDVTDAQAAEQVRGGGVTFQDISFVHRYDKASPTLLPS